MESSHAVESFGGYCSTLLTSKSFVGELCISCVWGFPNTVHGDRGWALSVQGGGGDDRPNDSLVQISILFNILDVTKNILCTM